MSIILQGMLNDGDAIKRASHSGSNGVKVKALQKMVNEKKELTCEVKGCDEESGWGPWIFCKLHWHMLPAHKKSKLAGYTNQIRAIKNKEVGTFLKVNRKALAKWALEDGLVELDDA